MVKVTRNIFWLFMFVNLLTATVKAQNIDAFARVAVSPREGVVRQPFKVTITVHSSTWFAEPLNFTNLQIESAFIIPFTRTLSSINYINNKKYATLSFYYLVFPYETGTMIIPALEINTSIPPEGGYKGQPTTIKTKPQSIKVGPVPSSKDQEVWMVAKNITIREKWSKDLNSLKVGDVVEREIMISANGTLPSLISPLEIQEPAKVSIYPGEPELQDKRNDQDANGIRKEHYSYLFENEGEVTIPSVEVLWWNPNTQKVYKRTLAEQKLSIDANPNLAMMQSLKDSLMAMSAPVTDKVEKDMFNWLWLLLLIPAYFAVYFGYQVIRRFLIRMKAKKAAYFQSEAWFYKQAETALKNKDHQKFINALYRWFDQTRIPGESAAISSYLKVEQRVELENYFVKTHNNSQTNSEVHSILKSLRKRMLLNDKPEKVSDKLNPV